VHRKNILSKILLVIFALEVDKFVTIIVGITNKIGFYEVRLNTLPFLELQAIVAAFSVLLFIIISFETSFKGPHSQIADSQDRNSTNEVLVTAVVMTFASAMTILANLVELPNVSGKEMSRFFLLVAAFILVFTGPLLRKAVNTEDYWKVLGGETTRMFSAAALCYFIGFLLHRLLIALNTKPIFGTEEFLGLGAYWYMVALLPRRKPGGSKSATNAIIWITAFTLIGIAIGIAYGLFFYSGNKHYFENHNVISAAFIWGLYGITPIVSYFIASVFYKTWENWRIIAAINFFLVFTFTFSLQFISLNYEFHKALLISIITCQASVLMIYIPYIFLRR